MYYKNSSKMTFIEKLNERYASKAMNGQVVPQEKINNILEAIRLTPTSRGLQAFEVLVITNQKLKEQIQKSAWNQRQVSECSHLLVFAAWDNYTEKRIKTVFDRVNKVRDIKDADWEAYHSRMLEFYGDKTPEENFQHACKQTYIALMSAMTQAMYDGVDNVPMEGFSPDEVDEILGLRAKGLRSTLLLPLGYSDPKHDWNAKLKKVRVSMDEFVTFIE